LIICSAQVQTGIQADIDKLVAQQVAEELQKHVPKQLQEELEKSQKELEMLRVEFHNS
jgi:hypothetical protein